MGSRTERGVKVSARNNRTKAFNDEKIFSRDDMFRWARYMTSSVADKPAEESQIKNAFWNWFNGPTPGEDRPVTDFIDRKTGKKLY